MIHFKQTYLITTSSVLYSSCSNSNSSRKRLTRLCFARDVSSVMKLSTRAFVSERFTVKPSPSLRPLKTSKPDGEDVGDVDGEVEGEIAVLIFVVRLRRIGIVDIYSQRSRLRFQVLLYVYAIVRESNVTYKYVKMRTRPKSNTKYQNLHSLHPPFCTSRSSSTDTHIPAKIQYTPAVAPNNVLPKTHMSGPKWVVPGPCA
jgi:hypothetical protein